MEQRKREERTVPTGMPLQRISWNEKIKNKKDWFKQNADYFISRSGVQTTQSKRNIPVLYQIYNSKFPLEWFKHITDPLSAQDPKHKTFPAKIRPTTMLRTNIDLLLNEYPRRPFIYQVVNMGEEGYNTYMENLTEAIQQNLTEHFLAISQQQMAESGVPFEQVPQQEEIEMPEAIKEKFTTTYKDALAIRGQRWLKRAMAEYGIRNELGRMFKDWTIAGSARSYKNIENGNFIYERVPVEELWFEKSEHCEYIEDAQAAVRKQMLTISEVVDRFYDELTEENYNQLEQGGTWNSPSTVFNYLSAQSYAGSNNGLIPVYHVVWKGKKIVHYMDYTDPMTGEVFTDVLMDEDTAITDGMKKTKTIVLNEVYEVYRIGDDIYPRMRPIPVQRNEMNNFSACKLPYNGRNFSDTHSENISVLELGIPFAIMYMIVNYTLEKTIAKNKGKIMLIDQNAVPVGEGWTEEKFFYYADALGYALINRNQMGVDKSFNQYTSVDMSLLGDIRELIHLRDSFKKEWDDTIGITDPRKGQGQASEGLGVRQESMNQSSIITDSIFTLFEQFSEKELQGILDYSKFINVDGVRAIYNADDYDTQLLDIDPNSYCNAELGLFVTHSAQEYQTLAQYKNQVQGMIQNGVKQSSIIEILQSNNLAELKQKLKKIEEIEMRQAQANMETEHEQKMEEQQIKGKYLELEKMLDGELIEKEWDRRDQNEMIKAEYALLSTAGAAADGDVNDNGIPDMAEITKRVINTQQLASQERMKMADLAAKQKMQDKELAMREKELKAKERIEDKKNATALKNKVTGEK